MIHKMVHYASGEIAATMVVVEVHIDTTIREATRIPKDVRRRAIEIKEEVMIAF